MSFDIAERLRSVAVDESVWDDICSSRCILFPYSGASAKNSNRIPPIASPIPHHYTINTCNYANFDA